MSYWPRHSNSFPLSITISYRICHNTKSQSRKNVIKVYSFFDEQYICHIPHHSTFRVSNRVLTGSYSCLKFPDALPIRCQLFCGRTTAYWPMPVTDCSGVIPEPRFLEACAVTSTHDSLKKHQAETR